MLVCIPDVLDASQLVSLRERLERANSWVDGRVTAGYQGAPVKFNAFDEWRFFAFADAGRARIYDPLQDQQSQFDLASYGVGMRLKTLQHLNSYFFVGMPLISQQVTLAHNPRVGFRVWGEF